MYIVAIAWLYVTMLMAVAEATSPIGTVLGAVFTFLLYGLAPVALMMYLLGTPARRRRLKAAEAATRKAAIHAHAGAPSDPPDTGGKASADTVAPVREKP